jgi:hypothetical protein
MNQNTTKPQLINDNQEQYNILFHDTVCQMPTYSFSMGDINYATLINMNLKKFHVSAFKKPSILKTCTNFLV